MCSLRVAFQRRDPPNSRMEFVEVLRCRRIMNIRWSAEDLARASAVGLTTIRRAELTDTETSMTAPNDLAVRRALESAGVKFIDENGGGAGVRLSESAKRKLRK